MLLTATETRTADRVTSSFVRNIRRGLLESHAPARKTEAMLHVLHLIQDDAYDQALDHACANGLDLERMQKEFRAAMADYHRGVAGALFCTKYGLGRGWLMQHRPEAA